MSWLICWYREAKCLRKKELLPEALTDDQTDEPGVGVWHSRRADEENDFEFVAGDRSMRRNDRRYWYQG